MGPSHMASSQRRDKAKDNAAHASFEIERRIVELNSRKLHI